jgi:hypothetical protein
VCGHRDDLGWQGLGDVDAGNESTKWTCSFPSFHNEMWKCSPECLASFVSSEWHMMERSLSAPSTGEKCVGLRGKVAPHWRKR